MLKGRVGSGAVLALGHVSEALMPFVRSVALARLLPPTEFGIAIAISTTASVVEMFTDLGLDRLALRAGAGDDPLGYRHTIQSVNLLRGVMNAVILALIGPLLATLLGQPQSGLLFSSLGLISLARGLINFEVKQVMQRYVYWPEGTALLTLQVSWTVASIAFAVWLRDARAMAYGIMVGQGGYMLLTHLLARHRWRLSWDRRIVREALDYGLPLVPSSVITAANSLLDRFVVGGVLGPAVLGFYSAVYMMSMMPRAILSRLLNNLIIPVFINREAEGGDSARIFDTWAVVSIGMAFLVAVGTVCLARPVLLLVYGPTFLPAADITVMVAADFIPKFLICLAGTPALALGHTRALLRYTLLTVPALGVAAICVLITRTLEGFLAGMLAGDTVCVLALIVIATRRYPYRPRLLWSLLVGSVGLFALPGGVVLRWPGVNALAPATIGLHVGAGVLAAGLFVAVVAVTLDGEHRAAVTHLVKRLRRRKSKE